MYKLLNSKKAVAIDDFIPLMFAVFIFLFAIAFLFISNSVDKKDNSNDILSTQEEIKATDNLLNFLQLPYTQDSTNSDLVIAAITSSTADSQEFTDLKKAIADFFDPLYSAEKTSWKLDIRLIPGNDLMTPSNILEVEGNTYLIASEFFSKIELKAKAILPVPNNRPVELRLFIGK